MEIKKGDQLFVNGKWYFDVVDVKDDTIVIRIYYKENPQIEKYVYRQVAVTADLFKNITEKGFIKYCTVDIRAFRDKLGSLVDRIKKESDVSSIFEDMGNVSMAGMSGTAGVPGSAGSGDIAVTGSHKKTKLTELGMELVTPEYRKIRKLMKTKDHKTTVLKTPMINLSESTVEETESDNEYKNNVFELLEYPTDNEYDIKFINTINQVRGAFINSSGDTIKKYFKDLYTLNKSLIKKKTSEWFQNNILILADIQEEI